MAQKQAAIKVGQAYIPVEVDFAGLGARMRKEINDELKKVGRSFELPADGLKIPVSVESKGGQKVIDQIVPSEKEVKSRLSRLGNLVKQAAAKTGLASKANADALQPISEEGVKAAESRLNRLAGKIKAVGRKATNADAKEELRLRELAVKIQSEYQKGLEEQAASEAKSNKLKEQAVKLEQKAADAAKRRASVEEKLGHKVSADVNPNGLSPKDRLLDRQRRSRQSRTSRANQVSDDWGSTAEELGKARLAKQAAAVSQAVKEARSDFLKIAASANAAGGSKFFDQFSKMPVLSKESLKWHKKFIDAQGRDLGLAEWAKLHNIQRIAGESTVEYGNRLKRLRSELRLAAQGFVVPGSNLKGFEQYIDSIQKFGPRMADAYAYLRKSEQSASKLSGFLNFDPKSLAKHSEVLKRLSNAGKFVVDSSANRKYGPAAPWDAYGSTAKGKSDSPKRQVAVIDKAATAAEKAAKAAEAVAKRAVKTGMVHGPFKSELPVRTRLKEYAKDKFNDFSVAQRIGTSTAAQKWGRRLGLTSTMKAVRQKPTDVEKQLGLPGKVQLQKVEGITVRAAKRMAKVTGTVGLALGKGFVSAVPKVVSATASAVSGATRAVMKVGAAGLSAGRAIASGIRSGLATVAGAIGGVASAITAKLKSGLSAGFRSIGKAGGAAMKAGLTAVKAKASDFIQGGVASFKHLGVRAGQAIGLALAGAGGFAAKTGVSTAAHFETAEVGMTTMLGSAEKAKKMLDDLAKFSARTPFELRGIVDSSKQLLAYGFNAEQIMPILRDVGDAAGALGLGNEGVDRITRALGQFKVKGRVMAEEMLQLTETGIPAYEMLAEHYGKTVREVTEMVHRGEVDAESGIEALRKGMHKRYQGLMDRQAETLSGIMSNIKDQFALTTKDLFLPMVPQVKDVMRKVLATLAKTAEFAQKDWPAIWERLSKDPLGYLNDMVPAIKAKLGDVDWKGLWGKTVSGFKYVWDGLGAIASQIDWKWIGKSLLDAAIKGLSLAYDMAKKLGNMFIDWFVSVNWGEVGQQVLEGLGKALAWMNTARGNLFGDVGTRIIGAIADTDWAAEGFKLGEALRNGLMAIWDSTVDLGERLRNWVASVDWGQVWSDVTSFTSAFVSGLFGGSGDAGQDIAEWFNSIDWAGIQAQAVGWYEGFASMLSSAWDSTKATVGDWTAKFVEWFQSVDWPSVGQAIREGLVAAWEQLLDWLANIGVWLWENLWPAIDKFIQFLVDPKLWAGIVDVLAWALNAIWDLIVATAFKLVEWFKAIDWVAVGSWFGDTLWKILESLSAIVIKAVIELGKLLGRILYDGFNFLLEAVPAWWGAIYEFATTWIGKIVQYMKDKFWEGIEFIGNAFLGMFPGAKDLVGTIGGVLGFNVGAAPAKPPKEAAPPASKEKSFEEFSSRFGAGYSGNTDIIVNQHFNGAWIEPEQAKRAAKLGARAGV